MRLAAREGRSYCLGDILLLVESRLDDFSAGQRRAVRDFLYATYDRMQAEIHQQFYHYETMWRILNRLDEEASGEQASEPTAP
jgi:hypothetical protein